MEKSDLLEQIKDAMRAHDKVRLSILRQVNQAIKQIEVDERRDVSEADLTAAIRKLQKVTNEELEALRSAGADAHAERIEDLSQQAFILGELIPKQLEGADLEALIDKVVEELGAQTKRDMGRVMGELTKRTNGNFDKRAAAAYVGARLA